MENKLLKCLYVIIVLLLIDTIILFASNVKITTKSSNNTSYNNEQKNDDYDVSMFDSINFNQMVETIGSKDIQVIYIGRSTCGYCVQFLPSLQKAQEEFGYKTKYYNIGDLSNEELQSNAEKLSEFDNEDGFIKTNFGATPMVMLVKDGKLIDGWVGYAEYESYAEFLIKNGFEKD